MSEYAHTDEATTPMVTLGDFESYVATNWIHPISSNKARQHVRAKLQEEAAELSEALVDGTQFNNCLTIIYK